MIQHITQHLDSVQSIPIKPGPYLIYVGTPLYLSLYNVKPACSVVIPALEMDEAELGLAIEQLEEDWAKVGPYGCLLKIIYPDNKIGLGVVSGLPNTKDPTPNKEDPAPIGKLSA